MHHFSSIRFFRKYFLAIMTPVLLFQVAACSRQISSTAQTRQAVNSVMSEREDAPDCDDGGKLVTTNHQLTLAGKVINYSATVGFLPVTLDSNLFVGSFHNPAAQPGPVPSGGWPKGCFFFTYYQVANPAGPARPLTFAFNGGPGSASLWLHLGALGPKRVAMGADGLHPMLPFQLTDNVDSPLDLTDVVMIDPVGTGFSYAAKGSTADQFFGALNDAESIATFVRNFLDQYKRRSSPLYLMGESYGGIRGSLVAQLLQLPLYLPLRGVILVSPWLSTTATDFKVEDNLVPNFTFLPSFAATAWYHKRAAAQYLAMDVGSVYQAAKKFAFGVYRDAIGQGTDLATDQFHAIAKQVSDLVGVSASWVEHLNLRIKDTDFFSGLLFDENLMIGSYDSRFTGRRLSGQDGTTSTDPSDVTPGFPFVSAINDYLRNDLGFSPRNAYVDSAVIANWPYNSDGSEFIVTHNLSQALADNPALNVFIASGYYDLVCPMGTEDYERSMLDPAVKAKDRVVIHRYESGHMVYLNPAVLHQLKTDLTGFYNGSPVSAALP